MNFSLIDCRMYRVGQLNSTGGVDIRARPCLLEHRTYSHVDARKFNHQERMARMAMKEVDERGRPCDLSDGEQLYCATCSEAVSIYQQQPRKIVHKHEDSGEWRCRLLRNNRQYMYNCHTCKNSWHSVDISQANPPLVGGRIPVLASSSMLHQFQGNRLENGHDGDDLHVDRVTIPGARIRNIGHALSAAYFATGYAIDVVLAAGLNDVGDGKTAHQIFCDIVKLTEAVKHHLPGSTVAVCTLPLPPKYVNIITTVPEERPSNLRTRAPGFKDRGAVIVELNRLIMEFNLAQSRITGMATHTVPRFHMRGLRTIKNHMTGPKKILETVTGHRFALWRETDVNEMLHLCDASRLSMGKAVINYFLALYHIIPTEFESKPQALYHMRNGRGSLGRNGGNVRNDGNAGGRANSDAYPQNGQKRDGYNRHHNADNNRYERAASKTSRNKYANR